MNLSALEPIAITCPRCGSTSHQRTYGPCAECMAQLYAKFPGVAREVETEDYIPQMNVSPNAVATKD